MCELINYYSKIENAHIFNDLLAYAGAYILYMFDCLVGPLYPLLLLLCHLNQTNQPKLVKREKSISHIRAPMLNS